MTKVKPKVNLGSLLGGGSMELILRSGAHYGSHKPPPKWWWCGDVLMCRGEGLPAVVFGHKWGPE